MTSTTKFNFNAQNQQKIKKILANYPPGRQKSAVLPLLDLAQRQNNGYLSVEAIECVAEIIGQNYLRVYEVASFYSMFNLQPVGKYHLQVCGTTPCWLRGAEQIKQICQQESGAKEGNISPDGLFSVSEVECLGACTKAPILQINDDYYENMTSEQVATLIAQLKGHKDKEKNEVN